MIAHPDAPAGKTTKYARVERERRFLLATLPGGQPSRRVRIEDRYLRGTRLRLRRSTDLEDPADVIFKLTQKIPTPDGGPGLITTIYLSAAEYEALAGIPAETLRKIRSSFPPLGVDAFEGPLTGLVLAEAEFETDDEEADFQPPSGTIREVTNDPRFTGGALATVTPAQARELLAEIAVRR